MQCVAPTLNSTMFGSSPGGQKLHVTPSELYRPGRYGKAVENLKPIFLGEDERQPRKTMIQDRLDRHASRVARMWEF